MSFDTVKQRFRRRLGLERQTAVLGDAAGVVNDPRRAGRVLVRFIESSGGLSTPVSVRLPSSANVALTPGNRVVVAFDETDDLVVREGATAAQVAAGISTGGASTSGGGSTGTTYVFPSQLTPLLCFAQATETQDSLTISVYPGIYLRAGVAVLFPGAALNLSAYVPGSGHCYVTVFIDSANTLKAVASTAKSVLDPLTLNDVQETLNNAPPGGLPVWSWALKAGQVTLDGNDRTRQLDLRQVIENVESAGLVGAVNPVARPAWVPSGRQAVYAGRLTVDSVLQINGEVVVV